MKTTQFLWLAPIAGLLALTACQTTSKHEPPREYPPPHAQAQPQAAPAVGSTGSYLVTLVKKAPGMVSVGDTFTYELTATAQSDVADTIVVDTVPAPGASYVSSEPSAVQDGNKLTWKLGDMGRGETKSMKATLKAEKQGELNYCATVSAVPRVCVSTMVGKAQLALKKTGPEVAQLGSNVTYNITVQNTGNTLARDVVVTDPVPDGFRSATGEKEFRFNVGNLEAGASKSLQITMVADKRGKLCNKASAVSSNAGKAESEACTVIVQGGIKITKSTKEKELFVNRAATYNIQVSNTGDTELTGVVVTDTAAPETVIATADGATVTGNTATWNVGTLAAGQKKDLTVKILSKVAGKYCDTATVTSSQGLRDSAQDCSEWRGVTGVLLEMVDDPDPIQVGETSKYTIRVTNQGSTIDISDLGVVSVIPPELEVVPGTISDGGTLSGNTITWPKVAKVAPKGSIVRTYIVKGVKVGDARSKVSITTSIRKDPIEKFESTTVY
jgi:uncharacterized repeat protein (TIGR01451 family)